MDAPALTRAGYAAPWAHASVCARNERDVLPICNGKQVQGGPARAHVFQVGITVTGKSNVPAWSTRTRRSWSPRPFGGFLPAHLKATVKGRDEEPLDRAGEAAGVLLQQQVCSEESEPPATRSPRGPWQCMSGAAWAWAGPRH